MKALFVTKFAEKILSCMDNIAGFVINHFPLLLLAVPIVFAVALYKMDKENNKYDTRYDALRDSIKEAALNSSFVPPPIIRVDSQVSITDKNKDKLKEIIRIADILGRPMGIGVQDDEIFVRFPDEYGVSVKMSVNEAYDYIMNDKEWIKYERLGL